MADVDAVQSSNFAAGSFVVVNRGDKAIARIDFDVTEALYPDTVFDPFGEAGDTVSKALTIDSDGGTGVEAVTAQTYGGAGGADGYERLTLTFADNLNGGFEPGETLTFSVDMDPNSVAGADKAPLDAGSAPAWDVGGVSGAELIGSWFTVTFEDGATARGQLHGAGAQAGGRALAVEGDAGPTVSLRVNGEGPGGVGSYSDASLTVVVSGPSGATARVVLTKGFIQPVSTDGFAEPFRSTLDGQLSLLASQDFPANNAAEFQTADIVLTGVDQDISDQFDLTGVAGFDFAGEDRLALGLVAAVIDPDDDGHAIGPLTDPIYLRFMAP